MSKAPATTGEVAAVLDRVPTDAPGAVEIDFHTPQSYNASEILFDNLAAGRAEKTAIYSTAGNATYEELCRRAGQVGNALISLGLEHQARILLVLDDTTAYPAVFFGAIRAGFVPVLANTLSPPDLMRFYLEDSEAGAIICDARYSDLFDGTAPESVPLIAVNGEVSEPDPFASFAEELEPAPTQRDDMAFWMYSSGSTGRPKGIVHLQHDMKYTAESYSRHILGLETDDICFSVPKIFFAYGLGNSMSFPFHVGASAVLYPDRPQPGAVFDCIEEFKPTVFFGLPTLYNALVRDASAGQANLTSVRLCVSAAEILSEEIFNTWRELFDLEIVEGLGSTEMLHIYLSNEEQQKKSGSAGKRVPGYELKLLDPEQNEVGVGEEGVLSVRGHSSAPCYWNRVDKTEETMRDGWIWTGDQFVADEDGFYFFRGRADDLIKVSGQWVYPMEIELCLAEHSSVRECAVLGVELADRRMTTKAFVVLNPPIRADEDTTGRLQDYVKKKLLPYKYPRIIEYLEELPKTGTGKIDRQALKKKSSGGAIRN